ncbi:MAG: hypothetical protein IJ215_01910 [Clostridia bacterium]|nr:hypothetical protein [Clostridia bacterium]
MLKNLKLRVISFFLIFLTLFTITFTSVGETQYPVWKIDDSCPFTAELQELYSRLPKELRDLYAKKRLKIIVYGYDKWSGYLAFYYYEEHTLRMEAYVKDYISYFKRKGVPEEMLEEYDNESLSLLVAFDSLLHELGHAYDSFAGKKNSSSKAFRKAYQEEKKMFKESKFNHIPNGNVGANLKDSVEYFASTFSCYFLFPQDLKEHAPKTYEFFHEKFPDGLDGKIE